MAKDFHAAFGNMNAAVRPGGTKKPTILPADKPVKEKKMTAAERRAQLHGVQTFLDDEEYEKLMIAKIRTKKKFEDILHDALIKYIESV